MRREGVYILVSKEDDVDGKKTLVDECYELGSMFIMLLLLSILFRL